MLTVVTASADREHISALFSSHRYLASVEFLDDRYFPPSGEGRILWKCIDQRAAEIIPNRAIDAQVDTSGVAPGEGATRV